MGIMEDGIDKKTMIEFFKYGAVILFLLFLLWTGGGAILKFAGKWL